MTTTPRARRASRLFPLVMAGALGALALTPTCALAATGPSGAATATYAGAGVGYNKVIEGHAAGTVKLQVEGGDVIEGFCIQYAADMATSGTYTSETYAASGVKNVAKAADIAIHHDAVPGKLTDARAENTAAQLAIWSLTDGKDISTVPNAAIVARAKALAAAAAVHAEGASSFVVTGTTTVAGQGDAAKDTVHAAVKTGAGTAVAGQVVKLVVGAQTLTGTTDATGEATFSVDAPATAVPATLTVDVTLPAGTVLAPAGKQAMVTTADAPVHREGFLTLPAQPAVTPTPTTTVQETPTAIPTPTATHTPAPVTSPTPPTPAPTGATAAPKVHTSAPAPTKLPFTGGWAATWMFLAALGTAGAGFAGRRFFARRG